ncbi:MAG TPA: hypothetical protein VLS51_11100 [Propionibacteriaceae bacterium]|nr:hypothetical protein [Propionibacteriaceae bacterium]
MTTAWTVDDVPAVLETLHEAGRRGLHAAGFFAYEAGWAMEAALTPVALDRRTPLAWFGLFESATAVSDPSSLLPDPAGVWVGPGHHTDVDGPQDDRPPREWGRKVAAGPRPAETK